MPSLRTVTLGCKVNQYETEFVRQGLLRAGFRDAAADEAADLCVVNTCTVTTEGDAKSRQTIRQLAKRNPQARIVVMGCYATRSPAEVARLPGVVEVVTDKRELPDLLGRFGVVDIPTGISTFANRQRAYVKVQDGCLLRCSFCIIPQIRPNFVSRPPEHIVDEVRRLVADGFREIVLTGIHLGHYGVEQNRGRPKPEWLRLANLIERIVQRGQAHFAPRAPQNEPVPDFRIAAVEHRSDRSDARTAGRGGGVAGASLPAFACVDAERFGIGAAADAAALGAAAVFGSLSAGPDDARPAGADDRHHRRLSRRNGGRFSSDLRFGPAKLGSRRFTFFRSAPGPAPRRRRCPIKCRRQ